MVSKPGEGIDISINNISIKIEEQVLLADDSHHESCREPTEIIKSSSSYSEDKDFVTEVDLGEAKEQETKPPRLEILMRDEECDQPLLSKNIVS